MKNRKSLILAAALCFLTSPILKGQTSLHPFGVTVDFNMKEYNGDYGNGFFKFHNPNVQYGLGLSYYFSKSIDATLTANYGTFSYDPNPNHRIGKFNDGDLTQTGSSGQLLDYKGTFISLTGRYKFYNDLILKENCFFGPYITAGVGYYTGKVTPPNQPYNEYKESKTNAFGIPVGAGIRVNLSSRFQMFLQSTWIPVFTDDLDKLALAGKKKDNLWEHKFGISYNFGAGTSSDEGDKKEEKAK